MKRSSKIILVLAIFIVFFIYAYYRSTWGTFLTEYVKKPGEVGAFLPSSFFVAKELTRFLHNHKPGLRILEAGAGSGAITSVIANHLQPGDMVDVVEIDPVFCKLLNNRFSDNKQIRIACASINDWRPDYKYDVIISTLPFSMFKAALVQQIVNELKHLSKPHTTLSYVEYMGAHFFRTLFANAEDKKDLKEKRKFISSWLGNSSIDNVHVWLSIPPAHVHHVKLKDS